VGDVFEIILRTKKQFEGLQMILVHWIDITKNKEIIYKNINRSSLILGTFCIFTYSAYE